MAPPLSGTPPPPDRPAGFRGPPDAAQLADPRLVSEGWESRFVGQGARLEEMTRLYRSLGFDVLEVPLTAEMLGDDCADCRLVVMLGFRLIYTRRAGRAGGAPG